jgi:hypothetical protein
MTASRSAREAVGCSADSALVIKPLQAFIPDARHAVMAAVLVGNAPLDTLAEGSNAVQDVLSDRTFENATVTVTGTPTFLTDINDYLQGGMLVLGGIAVLVMMVILLVAKVRWRLLPLAGMAVGIAWGFGAFGFTGTKLSLVTIAGLPILIGLGIEFAIQIQNRLEEERSLEQSGNPFEVTLLHMGPPLVTATIAAVIAFLTVKISKVPMVQDFGVLLSIGIVALLIAGVVVPTTLIGARERRSPTTKEPVESWVEAPVDRLGSLPRMAVMPLVIVAIALPILGLVLESGSKIESDPINWANQSSTSIKNARTLERNRVRHPRCSSRPSAPSVVFTDQIGCCAGLSTLVLEGRSTARRPLQRSAGWPKFPTPRRFRDGLDVPRPTTSPSSLQDCWFRQRQRRRCCSGRSFITRTARHRVDNVNTAIAAPVERCCRRSRRHHGGLAVVGVGLLENITANRAQLTIVALPSAAFVCFVARPGRGLLTMSLSWSQSASAYSSSAEHH